MPLARRYRADQIFEKRRLRGKWFTDTLDARVTSKDGNRYGQVFANRGGFATVYPMDTKRKAGDALRTFCQEFEDWAEFMEFDEDFQEEFSNSGSNDDIKEADEDFTPEVFDDTYLNMELALPNGDGTEPAFARVTKQLRDANGLPIGTAHANPILDSRMYEVEYQDGQGGNGDKCNRSEPPCAG